MAVFGSVANNLDILAIFNKTEKKLSHIDILINNAAVCPASFIKDTTEDEKILYTFFILLMLFMAAPFILNAEQKPLIPEEFESGGSGDHRYIII